MFSTIFFLSKKIFFKICKLINFPNIVFNIFDDNYSLFSAVVHIHFCRAFIHFIRRLKKLLSFLIGKNQKKP